MADVTVDLFSGSGASGSPVQTVVASRDGSGSFSAQFDRVAGGTYTATARQSDAAGNTGSSAPVSFTAPGDAAGAAPPDFAVFSTEESLVDASAGRLTALSSCEGDCRRTTSLVVSSRTARRLGLPRRGSRAVRLGGGATRVKLTRAARTALRRKGGATATLQAIAGGAALSKAISIRPSLKPSRIASRGLKLAGECSTACTMSARLIVSSATARRIGIRTRGGSVAIGSARVNAAAGRTTTFTVRLARSTRGAFSRARAADVTLEVVVSGAGGSPKRATRRITLR